MKKKQLLVLTACVAIIFLLTTTFQDSNLEHASAFGKYNLHFLNDKANIERQTSKNFTSITSVAVTTFLDIAEGVDAILAESLAEAGMLAALAALYATPFLEEAIFNNWREARELVLYNLD